MNNKSFVRHALSLAVAALGLVDLASALLSRPPERLLALRHLVPTDVLDTSRTFTLLAGTLLLLTASGLWRGKRRAFVAAMFLAAVSVPVNLLKAFDFEEATTAAAMLFLLGINGEAFTVKSRGFTFRGVAATLLAFAAGVAIYSIGGCWLVEFLYSPRDASLPRAFAEAVYQMFGFGDPVLAVSRSHHVVRWFLGSISVLGLCLAGGFAIALLRPARHRTRHLADAARVRDLIKRYGDSTVSAFAAGDDVDFFFSTNGRAVIAYRFESDTLLVIGDPIGPPEEMPALLEAFERFCREHDWAFGFYQVRSERLRDYRARGWNAVHIGEDPVLRPDRFTLEGAAMGTVRRQVRKLEKAGLVVRHFVPDSNPFDPSDDPDHLLAQLREISHEWMKGRPGGEKGFCMGRFEPGELDQVWLSVAWDPAAERVEAFCTWTPIWARRGWAIDLMRRRDDAPTGAMELLVVRAVEHARERGDLLMSLSLSALVKVEPREAPAAEARVTEDPARAFLIHRLSRFYDFQGLFRWKRKFNPDFEDRFLVYPYGMALPRIAIALVRAQAQGGLWSYFRREETAGASGASAPATPAAATGDAA
jgi:phosphatidylglycerol lysyltransferase